MPQKHRFKFMSHKARTIRRFADDDSDDEEDYEPRLNKDGRPMTESDYANEAISAVLAIDLLYWHDVLDSEVEGAFRKKVFKPALSRLLPLRKDDGTGIPSEWDKTVEQKGWRIRDRLLERQGSLGIFFTDEALTKLELSDDSFEHRTMPWLPRARLECRRVLTAAGAPDSDDPISKNLNAWLSYSVKPDVDRPEMPRLVSDGQVFGYGGTGHSPWLFPVFVQHDRSPHAERQALHNCLAIMDEARGKDGRTHASEGEVRLYACHTLCVSCLSVVCQFAKLVEPNTHLKVAFDDWRETRKWIPQDPNRQQKGGMRR